MGEHMYTFCSHDCIRISKNITSRISEHSLMRAEGVKLPNVPTCHLL